MRCSDSDALRRHFFAVGERLFGRTYVRANIRSFHNAERFHNTERLRRVMPAAYVEWRRRCAGVSCVAALLAYFGARETPGTLTGALRASRGGSVVGRYVIR